MGSPQLRHAKAHIIQELSGIEESEDVTGRAFPGIPNVGEGEGGIQSLSLPLNNFQV